MRHSHWRCPTIANWREQGVELANVGTGGFGQTGLISWSRKTVLSLEDLRLFDSTFKAADFYGLQPITILEVCKEKYRLLNGPHFIYSDTIPTRAEADAKIIEIEERLAKRRKRRLFNHHPDNNIVDGRDKLGRSAAGPMSNSKQVICLDDGTVHPSASSAARAYGTPRSAIIELCNGRNGRKSAGGKRFKYLEAA